MFEERTNASAGYICFYLPEGTVKKIEGINDLNALPFVEKVCLDMIHIGQKTEPMLHKGLRKGPILVSGSSRDNLEKNINTVQNTLKIEVEGPDGEIKGIIWG